MTAYVTVAGDRARDDARRVDEAFRQKQPASQTTRPASSTTIGDTGLWFVPIGETLPKGKAAGQGVYVNFDRVRGRRCTQRFRTTC